MSNFSIMGLGSGTDWNQLIASIRRDQENALTRTLGRRQFKIAAEKKAFSDVDGLMSQLKTVVEGFKSKTDFKTKSISTSDDKVVTATANKNAFNQSFTIRVNRLASNEVWQGKHSSESASVTSTDQALTITVRGTANTLNVTAGTTLKALADQINKANIGVTATVFNLGDNSAEPARLAITDNNSGKQNADQTAGQNFNISISSTLTELITSDFGATPTTEGQDSLFYLNNDGGTAIYRDSNTLKDVVPDVTIALKSFDTVNFKTLTVTESTAVATTKVQDFIKKYNQVIANIREAVYFNPQLENQTNPTAGNITLRFILNELERGVTGFVSSLPGSNSIRSLSDLGITVIRDTAGGPRNGFLQLDEAKFSGTLSKKYDDVMAFFEGVKVANRDFEGFGHKITNLMQHFLAPAAGKEGGGTIKVKLDAIDRENRSLEKQIQEKLLRIDQREKVLKAKFARVDAIMGSLTQQQGSIDALFQSLGNVNSRR